MDKTSKAAREVRVMASIMNIINKSSASLFNNEDLCRLSILEYLQRLHFYSECHKDCFIMALILIDRLMMSKSRKGKTLPFCIYRLCLAALTISIKSTEDNTCKNTYYARLGGVSNEEMVRLEAGFLKLINFETFISESEFVQYKNDAMKHKV